MQKKRGLIYGFIALFLVITTVFLNSSKQNDEITIYYTNDIHSYIDNRLEDEYGLTYSTLASLKKNTENSLLVDAGDHIQGTAYGSMDNGMTIIDLMNASGYDVATLGNHEFDYGMFGCMQAIDKAKYPYVSCNFVDVNHNPVLDSYTMIEVANAKVAFVGITTPESISSSTPAYFQDENGNYIYHIFGGDNGSLLYECVQKAIDEAINAGADYVIGLGHLGVDTSSGPFTSHKVISNISGLDAFIDGHSHSTIENEIVKDKLGKDVLLTQTGSYLNAIGKMTISKNGQFSSTLLNGELLKDITQDSIVKGIEDTWINKIQSDLGQVIGYSEVILNNYDANENRLVRKQSTNTADFCADALYYLFDEMDMNVDIAIMNGGGIRNKAITGEISYLSCKEIHTFGNVACLLNVTGQQILDALEWGCRSILKDGSGESGGLLHPAGLKYTIDLNIESSVQYDENEVWTGAPTSQYRVKDVQVFNQQLNQFEPLDLTKTYNLAGYNYTLRDLGDGFAMFEDATNILDYVAEDYMVLANYLQSFPIDETTNLPTIKENTMYDNLEGSERITIIK